MICGDPDLGDRYKAEVARDLEDWRIAENPVCRIKEVLRYPIQHAVIWTEIEHECPPLEWDGLYSLRVYARIRAGEGSKAAYQRSLEAAIRAALETCAEQERETLERHLAGSIGGARAVKKWKVWEL